MNLSDPLTTSVDICDLQNGYKLMQKKGAFRFGTDAVLLADFVKLKNNAEVVDLGTGTGIIAVLLCAHHPNVRAAAIEIQPDMAELAEANVKLNGIENRMSVYNVDMRKACECLGKCCYDAVVCNPPYYDSERGKTPIAANKLISRMESEITIPEMCAIASTLLKSRGRLSVIYPAARLNEMMTAMTNASLAPKRIRTIHSRAESIPKLVLLDAVKQGGQGLEWLPPLILYNNDGSHSAEWHRIYD